MRAQLSFVLRRIISQSSCSARVGTRAGFPRWRVMIPNAAIRNLIREDKIAPDLFHHADRTGQVGYADHEPSLASLYLRRLISLEEAMGHSSEPEELEQNHFVRRWGIDGQAGWPTAHGKRIEDKSHGSAN